MKLALSSLGALSALGLLAAPSFAGTTTVNQTAGTPQQISSYFRTFVTGGDMAGLTANFTFADNTTGSLILGGSGGMTGSGSGSGVTLSVTGPDTRFSSTPFSLSTTTKAIKSITFDAFPGKTVFDRLNPNPGTAGSPGSDFTVLNYAGIGTVDATYSNVVGLIPNAPVGDIYELLTLKFSGDGLTANGGTFSFVADTDNVTPVPETSTTLSFGLLLALGLGGVVVAARKKKATAAV